MNDERLKVYESLLNELADLEKECVHINIEYLREFGDEINEIFALKVESIALKKKIAYCVKMENNNQEIIFDDMEKAVKKLMTSYNKGLKEMIRVKKSIDKEKNEKVSFDEKRKIRTMYYKVVHLIHPDLHPELAKNEKISDLWLQCVDAYQRNDLELLLRIYDQVLIIVDQDKDIVLKDIEVKISAVSAEIKDIKENNPYKLRFFLEDEDEKLRIHEKNAEEDERYRRYIKSLQKKLDGFNIIKRKCDAK